MNYTTTNKTAPSLKILTVTTTALLTAVQWTITLAPAIAQVDSTTKSGPELNEISQRTTLLVVGINEDQQPTAHGSGSLIAKDGDRCVGVTNAHVVEVPDQDLNFVVRTHDDKIHETEDIFPFVNEDLAIFTFECQQEYEPIPLATYPLSAGQEVYLSGWPAYATPDGSLVRHFTSGSISTILDRPSRGYQVGYTNVTNSGMSGGQVLDAAGRLVAIHGVGAIENAKTIAERLGVSDAVASELADKTGFNYGIPVTTLLAGTSQSQLNYGFEVTYAAPQAPAGGTGGVKTDYVAQPDRSDRITFNGFMDNVERTIGVVGQGLVIICGLFGC